MMIFPISVLPEEYDRRNNMQNMIFDKIHSTTSDIQMNPNQIILYHASKAGIIGPIAPISNSKCDFGKGFYMGTDPYQPLTLISDFEESKFYVMSLDLSNLEV